MTTAVRVLGKNRPPGSLPQRILAQASPQSCLRRAHRRRGCQSAGPGRPWPSPGWPGPSACPTPSLPSWLLAGTLDMCALTGMAEWPRVTPRLG